MRKLFGSLGIVLVSAMLLAFTGPTEAVGCGSCPPPGGGSECVFVSCKSSGDCFTCEYECGSHGTCEFHSCGPDWECDD